MPHAGLAVHGLYEHNGLIGSLLRQIICAPPSIYPESGCPYGLLLSEEWRGGLPGNRIVMRPVCGEERLMMPGIVRNMPGRIDETRVDNKPIQLVSQQRSIASRVTIGAPAITVRFDHEEAQIVPARVR